MSTGFSGNMGFRMPKDWNFDQFHELSKRLDPSWQYDFDLDKVAYSGRRSPVTRVEEVVGHPEDVYDGQSAKKMGCDKDAKGVEYAYILDDGKRAVVGTIALMYSPICNTAWTSFTMNGDHEVGPLTGATLNYGEAVISRKGGELKPTVFSAKVEKGKFDISTPMLYMGGKGARVVGSGNYLKSSPSDGSWQTAETAEWPNFIGPPEK